MFSQVLQQQPDVIKAASAAALAHEAAVYREVTNAKVRRCVWPCEGSGSGSRCCAEAGLLLV
jgi:hypothetical protein